MSNPFLRNAAPKPSLLLTATIAGLIGIAIRRRYRKASSVLLRQCE